MNSCDESAVATTIAFPIAIAIAIAIVIAIAIAIAIAFAIAGDMPHTAARSQANPQYPPRFLVPDYYVSWTRKFLGYTPTRFTAGPVLANAKPGGWADLDFCEITTNVWAARRSFEGPIVIGTDGRPRNPRGRTGMCERGLLGKWGPNHAADPIVTRFHPITGQLQVVAILRKDTGLWALPGGMVDAGEAVSATVKREFKEEAGEIEDPEQRKKFEMMTDELFKKGRQVYRGYVDDPRNTDNAWMETTAFHFHCDDKMGALLPMNAGDDAADVTWLDVDNAEPRYVKLYASHKQWVDKVAAELRRSRK